MMVAYSFKKQFAEPILAGTKRQTIRAERKRHARPGEAVQLYTAMRTRHCKQIGIAVCTSVLDIQIEVEAGVIREMDTGVEIRTAPDLDDFARMDGFTDWQVMAAFWRDNHPDTPIFSGVLIRWQDFRAAIQGEW